MAVRSSDITSIDPRGAIGTEVVLQPIAAPSILGLFGFAGATFMVAAHMAGWYGGPQSRFYLFPFAAMFGGLAQFLAGMWAYRARDGLATAMHGMWGAFWLAYGLLNVFALTGRVTPPAPLFDELGYWFIVLAAITWVGTIGAIADSAALTGVLGFLAAGSTLAAIANLTGAGRINAAAGWLFIISAIIAWYTASAMLLEGVYGRTVLPVGAAERVTRAPAVSVAAGEPGVVRGQIPPQRRAG